MTAPRLFRGRTNDRWIVYLYMKYLLTGLFSYPRGLLIALNWNSDIRSELPRRRLMTASDFAANQMANVINRGPCIASMCHSVTVRTQ